VEFQWIHHLKFIHPMQSGLPDRVREENIYLIYYPMKSPPLENRAAAGTEAPAATNPETQEQVTSQKPKSKTERKEAA
jgi:hypothetical protein